MEPSTVAVTSPQKPPSPFVYYYMKVWVESAGDYESVIIQSYRDTMIVGAMLTLDLYLKKEYGEGVALVQGEDYLVEEILAIDLPVVTRQEVLSDTLHDPS